MLHGKGGSLFSVIRSSLPFVGGLAALAFMVGSTNDIRYRLNRVRELQSNSYYDASVKMPDAQKMLNDMLGERDINQWENLRGPRPWEDSRAMQDAQRQSQQQSKAK